MTLIDRLERRFGWIAIPGVVKVIVAFQALIWVLNMFRNDDQLFHKLLFHNGVQCTHVVQYVIGACCDVSGTITH